MAEDDIYEDYRSSLMDLTCNSKPLINMLTMLAEDNVKSAPKIVQVIETHLAKVSSDSKLPVLYLIDSIIKNVGGAYLDLFTQNIVSVFCSVFEKVDEKTRGNMFKLRQTWSEIFSAKKLYGMDIRVKGIDPAWPVMAPQPSQKNIHLNPNFLVSKNQSSVPQSTPVAQKSVVPKTPVRMATIPTVPEQEHSEVRQQLLAKQQELLKLQQQRVELELLQAKLKLEEQQKKPVSNFSLVSGSSQIDSLVSVSSIGITCTSYSAIKQDLQTQQHSTQQFQQLNSNMLSLPLATDPRINRAVSRLPVRDPRIQKMVPGLIHPATIITRPTLPSVLPRTDLTPVTTVPTTTAITTTVSTVVPSSPVKTQAVLVSGTEEEVSQFSPKKILSENSEKSSMPKKQILEQNNTKNIKVEKEDKPLKNNKSKTSSPMIIDLTADEDAPKKNAGKSKMAVGKKNERKGVVKKNLSSPDRKKKRVPSPHSNRNVGRDDSGERYKNRAKERRSSRSKTRSRSRSRSRTPPKRSKKIEKKTGKSSPLKNSSPKKTSKSKKAQSKESGKSLEMVKTGDVDFRQLPLVNNPKGDVDHRVPIHELKKESEKEPPNKKQKLVTDLDSFFGKSDQDYRVPSLSTEEGSIIRDENRHIRSDEDIDERRRTRERQKNWAQYKADHPDEFKSPTKSRENSIESLNDKDFRIPKTNSFSEDFRRRGFDRLGRPLLSNRPKFDPRQDFFRNQQQDDFQIALMLEKQDDILREAAEQMHSGVITTEEYGRVLTKFKNLSEQYQINRMRSNFHSEPLNIASQLPPSKPILIDGEMRAIKFFGRRAIVLMDNSEPYEVTFTGIPKSVFVDEKEVLTLGFGGERKEFMLDNKPHEISFGAPSREVYVDGVPYAAVFGGKSFPVLIDGQVHQLRIGGPQPNVELSDEPVRGLPLNERDEDQNVNLEQKVDSPTKTLDEDLRRGNDPPSLDTDSRKITDSNAQELGDIDMRVPPIPAQLERIRSSPQTTGSPRSVGSPERTSRWESVDKDRSRTAKPTGPWDSPKRDSSLNSWNSPDQMEWKNTLDTALERRTLLESAPGSRSNFSSFQGGDDLGKNDSNNSSWNNSNQLHPAGSGSSNWDWRINQASNFQTENNQRFENFPSQSQLGSSLPPPNIPPFQSMRPNIPSMMSNMMPNVNQMGGGYRNPRMMGSIRGSMDMSRNFNYGARQRSGYMMDNQGYGQQFRGGGNNGNSFNQMTNRAMGGPNHNFDSNFINDNRSHPMQGMDNFQGTNLGEKRIALLPHPSGPSNILSQLSQSSSLQPPSSEAPSPLDVSTLLAKLISTGLIKTDTPGLPGPMGGVNLSDTNTVINSPKEILPKEDQHIEAIPLIELVPECLKIRYTGVFDLLYRGTQCASCGMRFKDSQQDKYSQHLDWHFRANRREKDGAKKAFSRKWFYDVEDWYQFEETEDLDDRARSFFELQAGEEQFQADPAPEEIPSVSASQDQSENNCIVCSEPFQMFWVEEEEEWHLKGAIRREGKTYHPLCHDDFIKAQASETTETPLDESGVNPLEASLESEKVEEVEVKGEDVETETKLEEEPKTDVEETLLPAEEAVEPEVEKEEEMEQVKEETEEEEKKEEVEEMVAEPNQADSEPLIPFDEEIIGVISESEMPTDEEDNNIESKPEAKMVTLQPGGRPGKIVMKVKADSIINPIVVTHPDNSTSSADNGGNKDGSNSKPGDKSDMEEEDFSLPSPDPKFENFAPVQRGKELSGLCSIM